MMWMLLEGEGGVTLTASASSNCSKRSTPIPGGACQPIPRVRRR